MLHSNCTNVSNFTHLKKTSCGYRFNPYSAGIDFSRHNLTKVDPRAVRVKFVPTWSFFQVTKNYSHLYNLNEGAGFLKVQVFYYLISSLKTYHRTLHFTPWSLDLFIHVPFQLPGEHTLLQPFRRIEFIVHIAISVLPGTHFYLSQVKHLRVKCLAQGHTILTMSQDWEGRNMIFLWKSCTKRDSKPHGRQRHRHSATL